jgi:hypothetical protein
VFYAPVLNDPVYITSAGPDTGVLVGAFPELFLIIANIGRRSGAISGAQAEEWSPRARFCHGSRRRVRFHRRRHPQSRDRRDVAEEAAGVDAASLTPVGHALVAIHDWTFLLGPGLVVGVGNGLMLGYLMYRSGMVPQQMAVLGLIGGPLVCASGVGAGHPQWRPSLSGQPQTNWWRGPEQPRQRRSICRARESPRSAMR